jgi:hypothetical protein
MLAHHKKKRENGGCRGCVNGRPLPGESLCLNCRTTKRIWMITQIRQVPVCKKAYLAMLAKTKDPTSRCAITGLSQKDLRKLGDTLSIDRIDSTQGYVEGNMQLMSMYLNNAKGIRPDVPKRAIKRLLRRLGRIVESKLSESPIPG